MTGPLSSHEALHGVQACPLRSPRNLRRRERGDRSSHLIYVIVTHSGVTLAPFLGQAAAEEIARGRVVPQLKEFRPGRFTADGGRR